ncbi:hypothetical protein [Neptunicella marina]|uniref:Uncharacterized protein n=1 Tax=Neptunicella marina TaxID=2125989 RepID=A0A8J6IYC6_9ALTE|nr:hypothetical protein [Neptunicella marina]MBC3767471.1 hypothetical protein [Neptunicella marina]
MDAEIYLYLVLGIYVFINAFVTIFLFNREDLNSLQRAVQIVLVWLIPFFGAIGLWLFNKSHDAKPSKYKEFGGGPSNESSNMVSGSND